MQSACGIAGNEMRLGRSGSRWAIAVIRGFRECCVRESTAVEDGGWEHSAPWFLPCSRRIRTERSTIENARRKRGTPYPLVFGRRLDGATAWAADCRERSAEAENTLPPGLVGDSEMSRRSGRLSRMLDRGREHSISWSRRRLLVLEETEQARDRRLSGSRCWPASEVSFR